jgi:hypothetical protein
LNVGEARFTLGKMDCLGETMDRKKAPIALVGTWATVRRNVRQRFVAGNAVCSGG